MKISEEAKRAALDMVPESQHKLCPHCGSNRIGMFISDNDSCRECGVWLGIGGYKVKMFRSPVLLKKREIRIQQAIDEAVAADRETHKEKISDLATINAQQQKEIERLKREIDNQNYRGNTIGYIYDKMTCYRSQAFSMANALSILGFEYRASGNGNLERENVMLHWAMQTAEKLKAITGREE